MKTALVLGAGGFIGGQMVRHLKDEGFWVRGVDVKHPEFQPTAADEFVKGDLRDRTVVAASLDTDFDEVYQFAADMGGAGYIFTGEHDFAVVKNSALINLHVTQRAADVRPGRLFFSSSACIYPAQNQNDPANPICIEDSAYPANPDSEYGWEKLFSERLYQSFGKTFGVPCRIARYHNIYGPYGTWTGGREKAPAALARKVAEASDGGTIEIWGDGRQTRSFLYIDDCIAATVLLMRSGCNQPVNIGSEQMIAINDLAHLVARIAGKTITIANIPGPEGVRGRTSDNQLITAQTGWTPTHDLPSGMTRTYAWIADQVAQSRRPQDAAAT